MKIFYVFLLFCFFSCADLVTRKEKQELQTQINQTLTKKSQEISSCLEKHKIFEKFKTTRLRLDVNMTINDQGQLEKFSTSQTKTYPTEFIDCLFEILDKAQFPKLKKGELLELSQPFIFKA